MNRDGMVRFWQAVRRMLIAAVVGLIIGGGIWLHEAKGSITPPAPLVKEKLAND